MDVIVKKIGPESKEIVEIKCHEVTDEVREIVRFVKSRSGQISGCLDGNQYEIAITDIYYIEAVDNKCFLYCAKKVYETREKLYTLENTLQENTYLALEIN